MIRDLCPSLCNEYAAGTLDAGLALVMASYLHLSPDCKIAEGLREEARRCTRIAGALLETLCDPVDMRPDALQTVLARLDEHPARTPRTQSSRRHDKAAIMIGDTLLPAPLAAYLAGSPIRWRALRGAGRVAQLPQRGGLMPVLLLEIAAGQPLPAAPHEDMALLLILRGAYEDDQGRYESGTILCTATNPAHPLQTARADAQQGCLYLYAGHGAARACESRRRSWLSLWQQRRTK